MIGPFPQEHVLERDQRHHRQNHHYHRRDHHILIHINFDIFAVIAIINYCDTICYTNTTVFDVITSKDPFLKTYLGRVINIPLTEASDSPKIAAWHMVPAEVKTFHPFCHLFSTAVTRVFSRAANRQCSIYMGWLTLGGTRTGLTSIRWTSLQRIIRWIGSFDGVNLDGIIG